MYRTHIGHWLTSGDQKENKPDTLSVRYRSQNRFFTWCAAEGERNNIPLES